VAVLGLVSTATGQVVTDFAGRLPTVVLVTLSRGGPPIPGYPYPADVERRLDALPGVRAAGVFWQLRLGGPVVASAPAPEAPASAAAIAPAAAATAAPAPAAATAMAPEAPARAAVAPATVRHADDLAVLAVSPGFLAAARATVSIGRPFGRWAQFHAAPVCLVGAIAAKALGITGPRRRPAVDIDGVACVVIGIVGHAGWRRSLLRSVLMPSATAIAYWGPPGEAARPRPAVLIGVRPGAAGVVAREALFVISATRPRLFAAPFRRPRRWPTGRRGRDFRGGPLAGPGDERTGNRGRHDDGGADSRRGFGLRQAVGAGRRHIAAQVWAETAILGWSAGSGASLGGRGAHRGAGAALGAGHRSDERAVRALIVGGKRGLLRCLPGMLTAPARALTIRVLARRPGTPLSALARTLGPASLRRHGLRDALSALARSLRQGGRQSRLAYHYVVDLPAVVATSLHVMNLHPCGRDSCRIGCAAV
jgi:hypothetical protein